LSSYPDPDSLLGRGKEKPVGSVGLDKLIPTVTKPKVGAQPTVVPIAKVFSLFTYIWH